MTVQIMNDHLRLYFVKLSKRVDKFQIPTLLRYACGVNLMDNELRAGVYGDEPLDSFFFGKKIVLPDLPGIEPADVVDLSPGTFVVPNAMTTPTPRSVSLGRKHRGRIVTQSTSCGPRRI